MKIHKSFSLPQAPCSRRDTRKAIADLVNCSVEGDGYRRTTDMVVEHLSDDDEYSGSERDPGIDGYAQRVQDRIQIERQRQARLTREHVERFDRARAWVQSADESSYSYRYIQSPESFVRVVEGSRDLESGWREVSVVCRADSHKTAEDQIPTGRLDGRLIQAVYEYNPSDDRSDIIESNYSLGADGKPGPLISRVRISRREQTVSEAEPASVSEYQLPEPGGARHRSLSSECAERATEITQSFQQLGHLALGYDGTAIDFDDRAGSVSLRKLERLAGVLYSEPATKNTPTQTWTRFFGGKEETENPYTLISTHGDVTSQAGSGEIETLDLVRTRTAPKGAAGEDDFRPTTENVHYQLTRLHDNETVMTVSSKGVKERLIETEDGGHFYFHSDGQTADLINHDLPGFVTKARLPQRLTSEFELSYLPFHEKLKSLGAREQAQAWAQWAGERVVDADYAVRRIQDCSLDSGTNRLLRMARRLADSFPDSRQRTAVLESTLLVLQGTVNEARLTPEIVAQTARALVRDCQRVDSDLSDLYLESGLQALQRAALSRQDFDLMLQLPTAPSGQRKLGDDYLLKLLALEER